MKNLLFVVSLISVMVFSSTTFSQSKASVVGKYSHEALGWSLTIESDGTLVFYPSSGGPYSGTWTLKNKKITMYVPGFLDEPSIFTVKKDGFYNDKGKIAWRKKKS